MVVTFLVVSGHYVTDNHRCSLRSLLLTDFLSVGVQYHFNINGSLSRQKDLFIEVGRGGGHCCCCSLTYLVASDRFGCHPPTGFAPFMQMLKLAVCCGVVYMVSALKRRSLESAKYVM